MASVEQADTSHGTSTAIVFLTHDMNDSIEREMREIAATAGATRDLWATAYLPPDQLLPPTVPWPWTFVPIMKPDIVALGYDAKLQRVKHWESLRFNNDLFLISFSKKVPHYNRYWFIEYDVRYSGNWGSLLDELDTSSADLLCTLVKRRMGDGWHWDTIVTPAPKTEHVKGFMPICRLSRQLLSAIDQAYLDGWSGHYEVVWATVANSQGMLVEDIGGPGPFVPETRRNRFYFRTHTSNGMRLSTFSVWPRYSKETDYRKHSSEAHKDILWHPVK